MLGKLQEITAKYRQVLQESENKKYEYEKALRESKEAMKNAKENENYAVTLEKENEFLRAEIERCRFYKDKEEYGKFLGGLTQIKKKGQNDHNPFTEQNVENMNN